MKNIEIDQRKIGADYPPYIIAELSGNHNGDIERAKTLIRIAGEAGADAVKLQTYTADSLTIDTQKDEFVLKDGTWAGRNLYELYEEAHTPWDWFPELFEYARDLDITIFSSPFDIKAVDFLEDLDAPAYKIASNELTDWPLIEAVVKTGKPFIMSTGVATQDQLSRTIDFITALGGEDRLAVLHCVSAYPAPAQDSHLRTMIDIRDKFGVLHGLSDHTLGTATSVAAVALGACIIEKHYTLDRNDGGPDSSFSLEPDELKTLCSDTKHAWESLGGVVYGGTTDLASKGIFTRQLWSIQDIAEGEKLSWDNVKSIRAPSDAGGITPMEYQSVIGSAAKGPIAKHSPVTSEIITCKS
ncbi:MAG: pseudaminic acid synthase [Alphaproteobacteria bacterium]